MKWKDYKDTGGGYGFIETACQPLFSAVFLTILWSVLFKVVINERICFLRFFLVLLQAKPSQAWVKPETFSHPGRRFTRTRGPFFPVPYLPNALCTSSSVTPRWTAATVWGDQKAGFLKCQSIPIGLGFRMGHVLLKAIVKQDLI